MGEREEQYWTPSQGISLRWICNLSNVLSVSVLNGLAVHRMLQRESGCAGEKVGQQGRGMRGEAPHNADGYL
jgi:hypothetical protein